MNILFCNDIPFNPVLGGIERVTDVLTKSLLKRGYTIFYLCGHVQDLDMLNYDFPVKQYTFPENIYIDSNINKAYYQEFIKKYHIDIVVN
jgi:glycosyltransferase involved in cell wall biosynthesis